MLFRVVMLWTVQHHWPASARFDFNCYKHWAKNILIRPGEEPVIILSREGVTQGNPLNMVLYRITLVPLAEDLCVAAPDFLARFYADDATFNGPAERISRLMTLLLVRGAAM